ncbi:hypothetical protein B0H13DRAFT_2065585, partial [Mycena leptocephala]
MSWRICAFFLSVYIPDFFSLSVFFSGFFPFVSTPFGSFLFWGFGLAQDPSSSLDLCTCVPVSMRGGSSRREEEGGGEACRVSTLSLGVLCTGV